jgi:hypothetical protein
MYLEAHFLSDVLGGFTAGLAYLAFTIWAIRAAPALAQRVSGWSLAREAEPLPTPVTAGSTDEAAAAPGAVVAMAHATSGADGA